MAMTKLDANQVIKSVYSETEQALKTVPAADTSFEIELDAADGDSIETRSMAVDVTTLQNAISAAVDNTSSSVNMLNYRSVGIMAQWASLDQTNATIQLQGSLDGSVWFNEGSATTLNTASGSQYYSITNPYKSFRVVYTHGTNTTGTITTKYILKG